GARPADTIEAVGLAPATAGSGGRDPRASAEWGQLMVIKVLGVSAASWGLVMAVSPLLQIRQMWRRRSSEDVSVGFFAMLMPGFALWVAYGTARSDPVLVIPNAVALLVGGATIAVATFLRRRRPPVGPDSPAPTGVGGGLRR